jgi:hypothetical protein
MELRPPPWPPSFSGALFWHEAELIMATVTLLPAI